MTVDVDDYLPISGLQHLAFCERQCALIHVEGVWMENVHTASGRADHERVHDPGAETRPGVRFARALPIRSERLRLSGVADLVEFRDDPAEGPPVPFPVEYKHGRRSARSADRIQLCAQALALEEMLGRPVPEGAIYYVSSRKREAVRFTGELRAATETTAASFHELVASRRTPPALFDKRCRDCSLAPLCLPLVTQDHGEKASATIRKNDGDP
ncbi:MAG: CRISPR-associated protein Cas4 [Deltaproteobacteria bacterium]|nr:CRISPR-associated protein Cas4 [Deltaproteobacteria bacterium]